MPTRHMGEFSALFNGKRVPCRLEGHRGPGDRADRKVPTRWQRHAFARDRGCEPSAQYSIYVRALRVDATARKASRARATIDRPPRVRRHRGACGTVSAEPQPDSRSPPREAGFLQIVFAVWSSFFGVRKRRDHDAIARSVKPQHLIVAGLLGALMFVLVLVAVVRIVIAYATQP